MAGISTEGFLLPDCNKPEIKILHFFFQNELHFLHPLFVLQQFGVKGTFAPKADAQFRKFVVGRELFVRQIAENAALLLQRTDELFGRQSRKLKPIHQNGSRLGWTAVGAE